MARVTLLDLELEERVPESFEETQRRVGFIANGYEVNGFPSEIIDYCAKCEEIIEHRLATTSGLRGASKAPYTCSHCHRTKYIECKLSHEHN